MDKLNEITQQLREAAQSFLENTGKNTKAAAVRARKATLTFSKLGAEFRRLSVEVDKNK